MTYSGRARAHPSSLGRLARPGALFAVLAVAAALCAAGATAARAQSPTATVTPEPASTAPAAAPTPKAAGGTPSPAATGRISGTITDGTAGASLSGDLPILLIELNGNNVVDSQQTTVSGGAYSFAVVPDASASFVLRLEYQGVPYFGDPAQITPDQPTAQRDITVYETTSEAPALTIQSTTATLLAIDRAAGQLTLLREDLVQNPSDRVYVGAKGAPTLRLPAPDGTTDAGGLTADDPVQLQGGVVTVGTPLLPGVTSVVTRYTIGYDRQADRYQLRVTTPVQADRIEARAPSRFLRSLDPVGDAQRAPDAQVQGEQLLVVTRQNVPPGQGLQVDMIGLSGAQPAGNPLTDRPTVVLGAAIALVVIAGGAVGAGWWGAARRHRRAGAGGDGAGGDGSPGASS